MKKTLILMVLAILMFSVMPVILAEQAGIGGDMNVDVTKSTTCSPPQVYVDHTARGWYPNDQTYKTTEQTEGGYGIFDQGGKYNCPGYDRYSAPLRQNYVFTGETLDYYVLVKDADGVSDIGNVQVLVNGQPTGNCAPVDYCINKSNIDLTAFGIDKFEKDYMATYICRVIVQRTWHGEFFTGFQATDGKSSECTPVTVLSKETDLMNFNPDLALSLTGGPISFGTVVPGTTATSNTVYVGNAAEAGSGVVMDMYVAADDYFTDPTNPTALCGTGNGIKYDRFSYYATKGSLNSGVNGDSNSWFGLGTECEANTDEFTPVPSYSGDVDTMCRIINNGGTNTGGDNAELSQSAAAGLLAQGAEMSMTFKLNVPNPCKGSFTDGQFHFIGRAI
jgi:hypothetical protein